MVLEVQNHCMPFKEMLFGAGGRPPLDDSQQKTLGSGGKAVQITILLSEAILLSECPPGTLHASS